MDFRIVRYKFRFRHRLASLRAKLGGKKTTLLRKRTSALHYTRRRHASFVTGSCASGGTTTTARRGARREDEMRGRGRTEGRARCKWEVGGGRGRLELIQSRGGGSPLAVRGKRGWEATRDNHPFACHRNYTLPTLDLVYHADFLLPLSSRGSSRRLVRLSSFPSLLPLAVIPDFRQRILVYQDI